VSLDRASRCVEINVMGTAAVLQAFVPGMRERRSGKLVAVSSLVGQIPFPFESIYSATKFAVEGLVLSLRYEVEPFGIRVALIHPAQVSTSFAAKIHVLPAEGSPYRERVRRFIARDEELIVGALDPATAARRIVEVVRSPEPRLFNPLDARSRFFMMLNRFLPRRLRDEMLLRQMDIR
jgi:short-subunit dehydrogenase